MKKQLLRIATAMTLVAGSIFMSACESDEMVDPGQATVVPDDVKARFKELGFDVSDIIMDGENYLVEGDMIITPLALSNMSEPVIVNGPKGEQYRTYNLVSTPRTIRVRGYNVSSAVSTGIDRAIYNYNQLNLGIKFQRVSTGGDIVVTESGSGAGGVAGFPYGDGRPYNSVTIYGGTKSYSLDVVEHVVTHEIGHCVGFRHTDWFNRSYSCGSGGSEGSGDVGAVHIPGTPTGYDKYSIMNACFSGSSTGEFSSYDRTALQYLY